MQTHGGRHAWTHSFSVRANVETIGLLPMAQPAPHLWKKLSNYINGVALNSLCVWQIRGDGIGYGHLCMGLCQRAAAPEQNQEHLVSQGLTLGFWGLRLTSGSYNVERRLNRKGRGGRRREIQHALGDSRLTWPLYMRTGIGWCPSKQKPASDETRQVQPEK
jgi:hypothetical protein